MEKFKAILVVPIGLAVLLVPFSMLIVWNSVTLILFWLILTPALTYYLPKVVSANRNHFSESLIGLLIFYAVMVFMIYDHYQTDYFKVMILSGIVNIVTVFVWSRAATPAVQSR